MARVLVIDDSDSARALLPALLRAAGHEARVAAGGAEGLAAFCAGGADLVLCDLYMPDMDGLEVLSALRGEAPAVPVVLVTGGARGGLGVARAAGLLGAGLLRKPFSRDELAEAVRSALARAAIAAAP
jgi:CheY-like chemotaxis protein